MTVYLNRYLHTGTVSAGATDHSEEKQLQTEDGRLLLQAADYPFPYRKFP